MFVGKDNISRFLMLCKIFQSTSYWRFVQPWLFLSMKVRSLFDEFVCQWLLFRVYLYNFLNCVFNFLLRKKLHSIIWILLHFKIFSGFFIVIILDDELVEIFLSDAWQNLMILWSVLAHILSGFLTDEILIQDFIPLVVPHNVRLVVAITFSKDALKA